MHEQLDATEQSYYPSCVESLLEYEKKNLHARGEILLLDENQAILKQIFKEHWGVEPPLKIDVYNPSAKFVYRGKTYIFGRAEGQSKSCEHQSLTIVFQLVGEKWIPMRSGPVYELQDFRVSWIAGEMFGAGVETKPSKTHEGWVDYRMVFYRGKDAFTLQHEFYGPWGMKGINLVQLATGQFGVYTRPQGAVGGAGQIGFQILDSLDELREDSVRIIEEAPLVPMRFPDGEWGGVNQVIRLKNGNLLLIGHRAYRDSDGNRHYYPCACDHNPYTGKITDLGILARRSEFPPGRAKAPDLVDVLYTTGITQEADNTVRLLVGISDTQVGEIVIPCFC